VEPVGNSSGDVAIGLLLPTRRPMKTVVALAVKKAFVTRNGGGVLPRLALLRSKPGPVCLPYLPSLYLS